MSCYEWERGTFKLSCKEYAKFKRAFREAWNASLMQAYERAVAIRNAVLAQNKGKRGVNWWEAVRDYRTVTHEAGMFISATTTPTLELDHSGLIIKTLGYSPTSGFYGEGEKAFQKPCAPKKKDFPKIPNTTNVFNGMDASVSFNDDERLVTWNVSENNHACERAAGSFIGRTFFGLLKTVEWTRGTGGKIVGNDEYNQDSDAEGGGGNMLKAEYGPKIQKAERAAASAPRPSFFAGIGNYGGTWGRRW